MNQSKVMSIGNIAVSGDEILYIYEKGVEKDEKYIVCMPVCQR